MYLGDFSDEMILPTLNSESSLRINIYDSVSPPIVTANCALLTKANQHSSTGVVHTIDKVIPPVSKTILQIIESDSQFSILLKRTYNIMLCCISKK